MELNIFNALLLMVIGYIVLFTLLEDHTKDIYSSVTSTNTMFAIKIVISLVGLVIVSSMINNTSIADTLKFYKNKIPLIGK